MHSSKQFVSSRQLRTVRRGVTLAVGLFLVAGCGSSDGGASEADLRDPTQSPLAKLLGYDLSPSDQKAKELQVQQSIAECMKADGWEYEAVDYSAGNSYEDDWQEQLSDPVGYGEKYGYGVVRSYDLGLDQSAQTFDDPNSDFVNSLSMDEQTLYYETLYGDQSNMEPNEDGEFVAPPMEEQGCQGKAQLEVYGDSPWNDPDTSTRLQEIMEDAENDPDVKDALDRWATCMSGIDESYEWATPDEIWSYLYNTLSVAQGYDVQDGSEGSVVVTEGATDAAGNVDEPEVDEAAIEDLRAEELRIWVDDQTCQDEVDLLQVRRDAEERLVAEIVEEFPELGS